MRFSKWVKRINVIRRRVLLIIKGSGKSITELIANYFVRNWEVELRINNFVKIVKWTIANPYILLLRFKKKRRTRIRSSN